MTSRQAVRVLLLDEADRVLLVRFWDGDHSWWCCPGGGIEPNETDGAAARRELREELGDADVQLGQCIWTRRHTAVFGGKPFDQRERIYLGRVAAFEPRPSPTALLEHSPEDIRWWSTDELLAADDDFAPRRLPELVREIILRGPPSRPIDVGI
jgi:8-oxo-dGTP diphosphatase